MIRGPPGFLGARTEEAGVFPFQSGTETAAPPMQFCRAGVFGELFGTLAKNVPGGVAPAAKRIHHQGGELPAAADCGVQAPCQYCLI